MEAQLRREASRGDVVGSAEGGEKIIKRVRIGQIDDRELRAPLVLVSVEQIVMSQRKVEQITRLNAGRVVVVVLCAGGRDAKKGRAVLRGRT